MNDRSKYDELHDKYKAIATKKSGTRYERLAALVLKALNARNVVIHDLKLVGEDLDVKHQIDVRIDIAGSPLQILIECKDFDIGQKKIGLRIVRDFRSVIEDTGVDLGIILTCVGFTRGAKKYSASKGIRLVVLRTVESKDLRERIQKIVLNFPIKTQIIERAMLCLDDSSHKKFYQQLRTSGVSTEGFSNNDPVYFVKDAEREQFCEFILPRVDDASLWTLTKAGNLAMPPNGWKLQVSNHPPIKFDALVLNVESVESDESLEITSNRIAELLLIGLGNKDLIIFGDQLEQFEIDDETGEVIEN